jgi:hypothetical protein
MSSLRDSDDIRSCDFYNHRTPFGVQCAVIICYLSIPKGWNVYIENPRPEKDNPEGVKLIGSFYD